MLELCLQMSVVNKIFWGVAALEAVFFVVAFVYTAAEGGANPNGGKGIALIFQIALPFLILAVVSLIYWKTNSPVLHIVLLIAVIVPIVMLAGQWLRGPLMDRDIAAGGYLYRDPKMKKFVAAVANLDEQKVRELAQGTDVNQPGENGETPLKFAIEKAGNLDMIRLLLSLGAKPDSALPTAYASNKNEIVDLLLDNGANPNYKDEEGTPAFFYGLSPTEEHLRLLAQKGTDLNAVDAKGEGVLIHFATFSAWQSMLYFLELGAKDTPMPSGKTAAKMVAQAIVEDKQNSRDTSPALRQLDSKLNH